MEIVNGATNRINRTVDVIGLQGVASADQLTEIMTVKANETDEKSILEAAGYVYSHYFAGADGGVAVISKLEKRGGAPSVKGGDNLKFGYVQLKTAHPTDSTKEVAINFYVCSLSDDDTTRTDQLAEINTELTQSNKANGKPRGNYFIAGYFGTSDYTEITGTLNQAANTNLLYSANDYELNGGTDKGPYDTIYERTDDGILEAPDDLIYHTGAWEIQVSTFGGFRRGNTGSAPTNHYFCFVEAKYISTTFVAAT